MLSLLKYETFSRWPAVLGWGSGLSFFGIMYIAIYPEFEGKMAALSEISIYQAMRIDMTSFEGFIASSLILNVPVVLAIYAIVTSSDTLSGEEDRGTLELIVTMPLKRWQIVSMKALALTIVTLAMLVIAGVSSALTLMSIQNAVDVAVTPIQMFFVVLSCWPITLAILMIGLFFSAALPNRKTASAATTIVFIFSYFSIMIAGIVESLEFIKYFSLFNYLDSSAGAFTKGVQASDVAILFAIAAVAFVLALISFERRDITVGQWPWQRAKAGDTST